MKYVVLKLVRLLFILPLVCSTSLQAEQLVLVTSNSSSAMPLSNKELRKLYLGVPFKSQGKENLKPIRNQTDEVLSEVFLQNVIFMSLRTYERQLAIRTLRGAKRPVVLEDQNKIVQELNKHPGSISYMWKTTADKQVGVKILQTLWTGAIDQ